MNDEDSTATGSRPGSGPDLSRRMDRMERRQDSIETEVRTLAATVARVETNQVHAEELNKLRFGALDTALGTLNAALGQVGADLKGFMQRVEGIITGEIALPRNDALMAEHLKWRNSVDAKLELSESKLDEQAVFNGQIKLLGRLAVILVGGNLLAIGAAIYAVIKGP